MTRQSQHAREAEALATRLRRQNAAGGRRAAAEAKRAAGRLGGSRRATKNAGSWRARGQSPATILKVHRGGRAGDRYAEESFGAQTLTSNMLSRNAKERAAEWDLDQARHPRVKNLFQHISISRPEGHELTMTQWRALLGDFLFEIGAEGANYTSVVHNNTKNQHIHIIFSRSLPTGKLLSDSQNYYRWRAALRLAEKKNGLETISLDREALLTSTRTLSDSQVNASRRAGRLGTSPTFIDPNQIERAIRVSKDIESFVSELAKEKIETEISRNKDGTARGILFRQKGVSDYLAGTSISREFSLGKILNRIEENYKANEHKKGYRPRPMQGNSFINRPRERGYF